MSARAWGMVGLVLVAIVVSIYLERRSAPSAEMAVQHERTQVATLAAAKAETVFVAQKAVAAAARAEYRAAVPTGVALPIHDTVWVKAALAKADTVITLDSVLIVAADSAIAAHKVVEGSLQTELAMALRPKPEARISKVLTALYDPIGHAPLVSAAVGLRVIGGLSLVGVAFENGAALGVPKVYVGASLRL